MTQEEKRIKLAEAGGLQVIDVPFIPSQTKAAGCVFTDAARTEWRKCYPNSCGVYGIPDYFNDLNAVHELVNILSYEQAELFEDELCDLVMRSIKTIENPPPFKFAVANATADQRAEAIGLTLNLWKA
jgi:hypothetical protein